MTRFFRRKGGEDIDEARAAGADAPELATETDSPDDTPARARARKTRARKTRSRATKSRATKTRAAKTDEASADDTTTQDKDGDTPRRRGARSRTASSTKKETETETKSTTRRRTVSRRAKKTETPAKAETPPTPESEEEQVLELLGLMRQQAKLIEGQTKLLEALVSAQDKTTAAVEKLRENGSAPGGATSLEVKPRIAVFVDVPNILYAAERSGVVLDWKKVLEFLSRGRTLVRATAYAPISDDPSARRENERFVLPFMDLGYRIATKPLKRFTGGSVKANFDVELAVDIVTLADRLDVIALVSGDGDFRRVVEMVGNKGVRVEVMAFGNSTAHELREAADRYIDMAAYVPELSKR